MPIDAIALATLLHDPDVRLRLRAADQLAKLGPAAAPALPDLIAALGDTRDVRGAAAYAISQIGPAAAPATSELARLLMDEWSGNRVYAAMALGSIGPSATSAVPNLVEILLADEDPVVRFHAAEALGSIREPIAIDPLIIALGDDDVNVRKYAALAIGKFGEDAKFAVPALIYLVQNDEVIVGVAAAYSISIITGEEFPDSNGNGESFRVGNTGDAIIVVAAREWWLNEGQFMDWNR